MTLEEFKIWFDGQCALLRIYKEESLPVEDVLMVIKEKLDTVTEHGDCDCSKCIEKVEDIINAHAKTLMKNN